jgi:hypothetical protein
MLRGARAVCGHTGETADDEYLCKAGHTGTRNIPCGYSTLLTQVEYLAGYGRAKAPPNKFAGYERT